MCSLYVNDSFLTSRWHAANIARLCQNEYQFAQRDVQKRVLYVSLARLFRRLTDSPPLVSFQPNMAKETCKRDPPWSLFNETDSLTRTCTSQVVDGKQHLICQSHIFTRYTHIKVSDSLTRTCTSEVETCMCSGRDVHVFGGSII